MEPRHPARARVVVLLDRLTLALLAATFALALSGGFRVDLWGVRLSAQSPWRALLLVLVVGIVRHAIQAKPSFFEPVRRRLPSSPLADVPVRQLGIESAAAFLVLAALTLVLLAPRASALASVPDLGDPLFSIWRLAWVAHQIVTDPVHLFDANIFHPERFTLAYSDAMLVPALAAAPALWLGVPAVVAYNVALLAAIAASGAAMYALARALTGSRLGAMAAGTAFAFHAYRFAHYSHFELQIIFWSPLALLCLHNAVEGRRVRDGVAAGALIALQGGSSLYYGAYLGVYAAGLVGLLWIAGALRREAGRPLAAAAATALLLVLPLAVPYSQARARVGSREKPEVLQYSAKPADYAAANRISRWYYPDLRGTEDAERQLFPGIAVVVFAVVGAWGIRTAGVFVYVGLLVVAFDCSLGLNGAIYPWLYDLAPPFRAFRVPARFGTFVALSLSVLAAYGVARLQSAAGRSRWRHAAAASVAVLALDAMPRLDLQPVPTRPPDLYRALDPREQVVLAEFPFAATRDQFWIDPTYMYYSTFGWHRLVNGASGMRPRWYDELETIMQSFPSDESVLRLRRQGATHVMVHGELLDPSREAAVKRRLDGRGDLELVASGRTAGRSLYLYALKPR